MSKLARRGASGPQLGHDAFLDIVANLVGILIILVVVLGSQSQKVAEAIIEQNLNAQAAHSMRPQPPLSLDQDQALQEQLDALETETQRASAAFAESQRLEATVLQSDARIEAIKEQRARLLDLLEVAKQAWQEKQQTLDSRVVARAQQEAERLQLEQQWEQLRAARLRMESTPEPIVAVAHLPTPMAKTVFGEELHFRLKGGLLSVVPIDRLVQEIRNDFQRSALGNREGRMDSAVGPFQGYVARYEMDRSKEMVSQAGRVGMATRIELVNMVIEPLSEPHGTPIDRVIAGGGTQLDIELAGRSPDKTTITVWVYPDSFADFRRLKEHLYRRGYATAARPLPMNRPIAGSPQGSRSTAQ